LRVAAAVVDAGAGTAWRAACGVARACPALGTARVMPPPRSGRLQTVRRSSSISRPIPEQCGVTTPPWPKAVCTHGRFRRAAIPTDVLPCPLRRRPPPHRRRIRGCGIGIRGLRHGRRRAACYDV